MTDFTIKSSTNSITNLENTLSAFSNLCDVNPICKDYDFAVIVSIVRGPDFGSLNALDEISTWSSVIAVELSKTEGYKDSL